MSKTTTVDVTNSSRKRKRVQAKVGEVLTSEVLEHLQLEEKTDQNNAKAAVDKVSAKKKLAQQLVSDADAAEDGPSSDDTSCKVCAVYDICDQYICPKCVPKDVDLDDDFYCDDCSGGHRQS